MTGDNYEAYQNAFNASVLLLPPTPSADKFATLYLNSQFRAGLPDHMRDKLNDARVSAHGGAVESPSLSAAQAAAANLSHTIWDRYSSPTAPSSPHTPPFTSTALPLVVQLGTLAVSTAYVPAHLSPTRPPLSAGVKKYKKFKQRQRTKEKKKQAAREEAAGSGSGEQDRL